MVEYLSETLDMSTLNQEIQKDKEHYDMPNINFWNQNILSYKSYLLNPIDVDM